MITVHVKLRTSAFDAVRLQTTSGNPFLRIFCAIPFPILPRPRKATFSCDAEVIFDNLK